MNFFNKISDNKYFRSTQRSSVIFGSCLIGYFLIEEYVLPIESIENLLIISFLFFLYIIFLKEAWVKNDFLFKKGSFIGIIYTIIGIPIALLLSFVLMVSFGWMTLFVKSYYENYDNLFDRIVVVYISPVVSILTLGALILSRL